MSSSSRLRSSVEAGLSQRSDFPIHPRLSALLIIDIQAYLSNQEERVYYCDESHPRSVKNIQKLAQAFRNGMSLSTTGSSLLFVTVC